MVNQGFPGGLVVRTGQSNAGDAGSVLEKENGNPFLQYSAWEIP